MAKEETLTTGGVTGVVRFSFVQVFEPKAMDANSKPKYSVQLLIRKDDKVTLSKIKTWINNAKELGKSKWDGKIPPKLRMPMRDGDAEKPDDENYKGCWFVSATSDSQPGLVDAQRNPILDKEGIKSGYYGRADINFYAFTKGGNGIACGLNNLQKTKEGPLLGGGRKAAEDAFDDGEFFDDQDDQDDTFDDEPAF